MKHLEIFDNVAVLRDTFDAGYKKLEDRRKRESTENKRLYKPGEPLRQHEEESKAKFKEDLEKLRDKMREDFEEVYTHEAAKQQARVLKRPDSVTFETLKSLEGLPISEREYAFLIDNYRGRSLWSDKMLRRLAEANDIEVGDRLDPGVETVMSVLDDLKARVELFISAEGKDRGSYVVLDSVHDARLAKIEKRLSAGADPGFTPDKQAKRLLLEAADSFNVLEQTQKLSHAYNTASPAVQAEMIDLLEGGKVRLHDVAVKNSGIPFDEVVKQNSEMRRKAKEAADAIIPGESFIDTAKKMAKAGGIGNNPFLADTVLAKHGSNERIRTLVEVMESTMKTATQGTADQASGNAD